MAASAGAIRAGSAYVEIFARDGQFQQAMSRIRTRLQTLGAQMRQAGTGMVLGGTAIGAPFVFAARTAAAFSLEMARVRANTGATDQQFAALNAAAKSMSVQFGRAPEEVAGAMSELAKAGLDANGVMNSISPILAVAAADNMELARAVEVVVSTMAQFGMTTNDFGSIADKLQATANASTTSVDLIGEALTYVGPKAQEAGQSFDDVAAAIATLADAGLRGSLGGTGLARVIESIANEEEKLAALGVSTRDAAGQMRPFMDVLEDLGKVTGGMSNLDRIRAFTDIFEIRGANAAMSLSTMRDKFNDVLGTIQNSGGTALGKATLVMNSFGGAVAQLGAQFGVFKVQVVESMGPIATQAVQGFTRMLAVVGEFVSRNGTLVTVVAGGAAALFGLGIAAITAGIALQGLATGLRIVQAILPVIPALFSPIGLAVAAVSAAIGGGVIIARTLSPAFREETDAIMAALMRLDFGAAWEVMNVNLSIALVQMYQSFAQAFDFVKNTVLATSYFISDKLTEGLDRFMGLFGQDILTLSSGFEKLGIYFRAAFDWDYAVNGMSDALKKVDDEVDAARRRAPTADARAEQRRQEREKLAQGRNDEIKKRDEGFEGTIKALREDAEGARRRALGVDTKQKEEERKPDAQKPDAKKLPPAPPGAFMPPKEEKEKRAKAGQGISSAGNWSGIGLQIGPELSRLEDPAERTAEATQEAAALLRQMAGKGESIQGDRAKKQARADELIGELGSQFGPLNKPGREARAAKIAELERLQSDIALMDAAQRQRDIDAAAVAAGGQAAGPVPPDQFAAQLAAVEAMAADPNMTAEQLLAANPAAAAAMPAVAPQAMPGVAMDVIAPRAVTAQRAFVDGTQAAMDVSGVTAAMQTIGGQIVAAITEGTAVSKGILGVLTKIADKKPEELAFT